MSEYSTPLISASNSDNYAIAGANTKKCNCKWWK